MIFKLVTVLTLFGSVIGCSGSTTEFSSVSKEIFRAARSANGQIGDFHASTVMSNNVDSTPPFPPPQNSIDNQRNYNETSESLSAELNKETQAQSTVSGVETRSIPTSLSKSLPPSSAAPESEYSQNGKTQMQTPAPATQQNSVDDSSISACINSFGIQNQYTNYKVVTISGTNRNNQTIFEDPAAETGSLILLKITLKNVNNSSIKLLNSKSAYCINMQVRNMNAFKFQMACRSKVGIVKMENQNSNNSSFNALPVVCD